MHLSGKLFQDFWLKFMEPSTKNSPSNRRHAYFSSLLSSLSLLAPLLSSADSLANSLEPDHGPDLYPNNCVPERMF